MGKLCSIIANKPLNHCFHHVRFSLASFTGTIAIICILLLISQTAHGDSVADSNTDNVTIPDAGIYVASTIAISSAPASAVVTGIDVYFKCIHTYSSDLTVDLNADSTGSLGNRNLWNREGGSADNPTRTTTGITTFNGLSVNRTWYLYAKDFVAGDSGYIDEWTITIYYSMSAGPPTIISTGDISPPGPSVSTTTPTFQWQSVSGADGYALYISKYNGSSYDLIFDSSVIGGPITGTSYTLPVGYLVDGGQYRWNMASHNSAGYGRQM